MVLKEMKMKKLISLVFEKIGDYFPIIAILLVLGILSVVIWAAVRETNARCQYVEDKNIALQGCVRCKLSDDRGYWLFTCNGSEYSISRLEWVNLNVSECK